MSSSGDVARPGDTSAFTAIHDKYYEDLLRIAVTVTVNVEDAGSRAGVLHRVYLRPSFKRAFFQDRMLLSEAPCGKCLAIKFVDGQDLSLGRSQLNTLREVDFFDN
jgi:hypothetical protein